VTTNPTQEEQPMNGRMDGKVVLITGAARGQGRSHAVRLAEEGADIIALDLCREVPGTPHAGSTPDDLAETVSLVEALGRRIVASAADVRDLSGLRAAVDDGVSRLGRLDAVSANAGISTQAFPVADMPEQTWQDVIDVNLTGVWHTAKATIPHLVEAGRGGSIVITSSTAGLKGYPNVGNYTAAKHGTVGLMRTLALELAPQLVRVNSIHTSIVNTQMVRADPSAEHSTEDRASENALPVPWIESVDVSNALLFLLSDEARFITGVALPVDAGALL
jgi:SDR family mycofactocin-dependent oxidoreductase